MARVCLVDPTTEKFPFTYLPTGLCSIAAVLEKMGHDVTVHIGNADIPDCDFLGISATLHQYPMAISIAKRTRAHTYVLGGPYVTTSPAVIKSPVFDYGIIGDGERAMSALVGNYDPRRIAGLAYKSLNTIVVNSPMPIDTCDLLPPAYHLISNFSEFPKFTNVCKTKNVRHDGIIWKEKHTVFHALVFDKAMAQLRSMGVRRVCVTDEVFVGGWTIGKLKMAIESLDRFTSWVCRTDVESANVRRLDKWFAGSRCNGVELRIITASDRMLSEYELPDIEQIDLAIGALSKFGLTLHVIIGLPGETIASLEDTREWLRQTKLPVRVETFVPFPGTRAWEGEFDRFGFNVTGVAHRDFYINDHGQISDMPWRSETIPHREFIKIRNEMISEFNIGS